MINPLYQYFLLIYFNHIQSFSIIFNQFMRRAFSLILHMARGAMPITHHDFTFNISAYGKAISTLSKIGRILKDKRQSFQARLFLL
jgi:hypothetical protein